MQRRNQILEIILIIVLIIFVIVLTTFLIVENNLKLEREKQEAEERKANSLDNSDIIISQEQALQIGRELYEIAKKTYFKEKIEYVMDNTTSGEIEEPLTVMIQGGIYGQIANYDSFIGNKFTTNGENTLKSYLNIVTAKENEESSKLIYYIPLAERGGNISYINTDLKILNITSNEVTFNAVSKYYTGENEYNPNELDSNLKTEEKTNLFIIKKSEDNVWKIDTFTLPN